MKVQAPPDCWPMPPAYRLPGSGLNQGLPRLDSELPHCPDCSSSRWAAASSRLRGNQELAAKEGRSPDYHAYSELPRLLFEQWGRRQQQAPRSQGAGRKATWSDSKGHQGFFQGRSAAIVLISKRVGSWREDIPAVGKVGSLEAPLLPAPE